MNTEYLNTTISDHDVTLAIPGDLVKLRQRLVEALKQVGYLVLEEQPLKAKRIRKGVTCGFNVANYPTTLTVSLKQTNDVAVMATFSFEIKSYTRMTRGDRQTLLREAEAIAALASERLAITACRSCGTPSDDESHFCRRCGAPLVVDVPELEVFRLTKGTRNGYQHLTIGLLTIIFTTVIAFLIFMIKGGQKPWAPVVFIPFAVYGLFLVLQGLFQLQRTLNPKSQPNAMRGVVRVTATVDTTALDPARTPVASITEGTTELLIPANKPRVAEPVRRKAADTDEIEADGLM